MIGLAALFSAADRRQASAESRWVNGFYVFTRRAAAVDVALIVATAVVLAGCGTPNTRKASSPAAASSSTAPPRADLLFKRMTALLPGIRQVRLVGGAVVPGVGPMRLDLSYHDGDVAGTLTVKGAAVALRVIGQTAYLNGSAAFWKTVSGDTNPDPATLARLAGHWVSMPVGDTSIASNLTLSKLAGDLSGSAAPAPTVPVIRQLRGGVPVYVVRDGTTAHGGTFVTAANGKPYLLELEGTEGGQTAKMTFSDYGSTPPVTAPPAAVPVTTLSSGQGLLPA